MLSSCPALLKWLPPRFLCARSPLAEHLSGPITGVTRPQPSSVTSSPFPPSPSHPPLHLGQQTGPHPLAGGLGPATHHDPSRLLCGSDEWLGWSERSEVEATGLSGEQHSCGARPGGARTQTAPLTSCVTWRTVAMPATRGCLVLAQGQPPQRGIQVSAIV